MNVLVSLSFAVLSPIPLDSLSEVSILCKEVFDKFLPLSFELVEPCLSPYLIHLLRHSVVSSPRIHKNDKEC